MESSTTLDGRQQRTPSVQHHSSTQDDQPLTKPPPAPTYHMAAGTIEQALSKVNSVSRTNHHRLCGTSLYCSSSIQITVDYYTKQNYYDTISTASRKELKKFLSPMATSTNQ